MNTISKIYDIIRLSDEFSKKCTFSELIPDDYIISKITYKLNDTEYEIFISKYQFGIYFYNKQNKYSISQVSCEMGYYDTNKKYIGRFKKLLKNIEKLDLYIRTIEIDKIRLMPVVNNYMHSIHAFDGDIILSKNKYDKQQNIYFDFSKSKIKQKSFNSIFNLKIELNPRYNITVRIYENKITYTWLLYYDGNNDTLVLINMTEIYDYHKTEISNIIRKERLLNIINNND